MFRVIVKIIIVFCFVVFLINESVNVVYVNLVRIRVIVSVRGNSGCNRVIVGNIINRMGVRKNIV